jgi:hypothetical protein
MTTARTKTAAPASLRRDDAGRSSRIVRPSGETTAPSSSAGFRERFVRRPDLTSARYTSAARFSAQELTNAMRPFSLVPAETMRATDRVDIAAPAEGRSTVESNAISTSECLNWGELGIVRSLRPGRVICDTGCWVALKKRSCGCRPGSHRLGVCSIHGTEPQLLGCSGKPS